MSSDASVVAGHVGVIGDPIHHSLSPTIHTAAYRALGLDLSAGAYLVRAGEARAALHGARALGFVGLAVTTPHKEAIALAADQRTSRVERLGAANTIVFAAGISVADNTDGAGLLGDLQRALGFSPTGARCVVLGAGGAARAVVLALGEAGAAEVVVVNRTRARAEAAAALAGEAGAVGTVDRLASAELVVNATSIGLASGPEAQSSAASLAAPLGEGQLVVDLVYRPTRTAFLSRAAEQGATVRNGLGMLVHQAALQVELFTGQAAPLEVMWESVSSVATS